MKLIGQKLIPVSQIITSSLDLSRGPTLVSLHIENNTLERGREA
jgi:hypothetical protein